ncbi:zinc finger protein 333-like [Centropristis striata]|uniref:zinc finger protein 333-like n=1 Tax=Centropristis striata TaxID=184440 RepID=UPI0027E215BC|nr:zinc finger protein 333-like [Centropristis striata]
MSKVQTVRALVEQRLTAAAEEIFGLFERTIGEYEEELCRSREKNERQQKLLDAVFNPQLHSHRADLQQLSLSEEEFPSEQQERSCSLDQDQEEPEPPHIKEEQEEPWTSQEGEQLHGLTFTPVPVKSEEDEEKPQFLQLHQTQTEQIKSEADVEDFDVQQLLVSEGEVPSEQQERSCSLDQDQEEPEPPHIKEEQGEPWTSQEGEQLQGLTFTPVPVKSEEDEEIPQSSQLHQTQTEQMETEADGEDCGGPEPDRNSGPDPHLQPDSKEEPADSSETETDDSGDWKETREPQSGLNCLKKDGGPVRDSSFSAGEKRFSCSECGKSFVYKYLLKRHMVTHTGEKPFSCSVCKKSFTQRDSLRVHMRIHTGEKPFSCTVCQNSYSHRYSLKQHMRCHTREKPFTCSVCIFYPQRYFKVPHETPHRRVTFHLLSLW